MYNEGKMVAYAQYNASGTNQSNWLNAQRLDYSSWGDIHGTTQTDSTFGVDGFSESRRVCASIIYIYIYDASSQCDS